MNFAAPASASPVARPLTALVFLLLLSSSCDSSQSSTIGALAERGVEAAPSSLRQALQDGDRATMDLLLAAGVPPEQGLIPAARLGRCGELQRLLEAGAGAQGIRGARALAWSIQGRHRECADLLVAAGAEIDAGDPSGETLLMAASRAGRAGRARMLIDNGTDLQLRDQRGRSALLLAIANRRRSTARLLVEEGADPEARSDEGWTPLTLAARQGDRRIVELLLDEAVRVGVPNGDGFTALMLAARWGHSEVVKQLLEAGADPARAAPGGMTAADLAAEAGHVKIRQRLLRALAKREQRVETGA